jgi:DNA repair protein RAD50
VPNLLCPQEERQGKARNTEDNLESMQILPASLRALQSDIEEKKIRLQKLKQDHFDSNFDKRLAEKAENSRRMEAKREQLSFELQALSLQADSRAKLEINRKEVKIKASEIERL